MSAGSVLVAATAVVVVAAVFAVYSLLDAILGPAGAGAAIAAAIAVLLGAGALVMIRKGRGPGTPQKAPARSPAPPAVGGLRERLFGIARERPVLAAAAAVAAGLVAWRNPRLLGAVMRLFEPKGEGA